MKISTRGRYALRLMLDLALQGDEKPTQIKEIAKRQEISLKYLEQIISILNKAGFVKSVRGPQGGYFLKKAPEEYTVGMILRLTEGELTPVSCAGEEQHCERFGQCGTSEVWRRLNEAINGVVDSITLADIIRWQREKNSNFDFII